MPKHSCVRLTLALAILALLAAALSPAAEDDDNVLWPGVQSFDPVVAPQVSGSDKDNASSPPTSGSQNSEATDPFAAVNGWTDRHLLAGATKAVSY